MEPKEIVLKNEDLINLFLEHQYVPQAKNVNVVELEGAYKQIFGTVPCLTCGGGMQDFFRQLKIALDKYKAEKKTSYHTFPKHK